MQSETAHRGRWLRWSQPASFCLCGRSAAARARSTRRAGTTLAARTVAGAYHVHTTRSDGHRRSSRRRRRGGARRTEVRHPHRPRRRHPSAGSARHTSTACCVLDGVEISTDEGHYVALDMPRAPYPLGGAADAVVEDVRRLGGFGIAAHPDSPKPALRWTDERAPIDGIEWLEHRQRVARRIAAPAGARRARPTSCVRARRWRRCSIVRRRSIAGTRCTRFRPVVALAGADAHGGVGPARRRTPAGAWRARSASRATRRASARSAIASCSTGRSPATPAADARAVYGAIRKGSVFTAIDAVAGPALLDFHVEAGSSRPAWAGVCPATRDATIVARALLPPGGEMVLLRDGREVSRARRDPPGRIRCARRLSGRSPGAGAPATPPVPWLVSNPVYFGGVQRRRRRRPEPSSRRRAGRADCAVPLADRKGPGLERDPPDAAITTSTLEYKLGGRAAQQPVRRARHRSSARRPFSAIDLVAGGRPARFACPSRSGRRRPAVGEIVLRRSCRTADLRIPLSELRPIGQVDAGAADSVDRRDLDPAGRRSRQRRPRPVRRAARCCLVH